MAKKSKTDKLVDEAFHEVYTSKPSTLGKNQTKAEERAQLTAIALIDMLPGLKAEDSGCRENPVPFLFRRPLPRGF